MGPKPVRIGLKRKAAPSASANDDFSDEWDQWISQAVSVADPDETLPPLTKSAIKELEKIVDLDDEDQDSTEDIFADEVECDNDPDYVPDPDDPGPSTSKGKALI